MKNEKKSLLDQLSKKNFADGWDLAPKLLMAPVTSENEFSPPPITLTSAHSRMCSHLQR